MEIVKRENVNVANVLIFEGVTSTEVDNELEVYLQRYGSINRNLVIDDPNSEFHRSVIVEYNHNSAIQSLCPFFTLNFGESLRPSCYLPSACLSYLVLS